MIWPKHRPDWVKNNAFLNSLTTKGREERQAQASSPSVLQERPLPPLPPQAMLDAANARRRVERIIKGEGVAPHSGADGKSPASEGGRDTPSIPPPAKLPTTGMSTAGTSAPATGINPGAIDPDSQLAKLPVELFPQVLVHLDLRDRMNLHKADSRCFPFETVMDGITMQHVDTLLYGSVTSERGDSAEFAKQISSLPKLRPDDAERILWNFSLSVEPHYVEYVPRTEQKEQVIFPFMELSEVLGLSIGEVDKVSAIARHARENTRATRTGMLRQGVLALTRVLPELKNTGSSRNWDRAVDLLGLILHTARVDDGVKHVIHDALSKLPLEDTDLDKRISPAASRPARERIIHDLSVLNDTDKRRRFFKALREDIQSPDYIYRSAPMSADIRAMSMTMTQLAHAMPGVDDMALRNEIGELCALFVALHAKTMDADTRAACESAAGQWSPSDLLIRLIKNDASSWAINKLVPAVNRNMAQLKENVAAIPGPEQKRAIEDFHQVLKAIFSGRNKSQRARRVQALLPGIRDLGKLRPTSENATLAQRDALNILIGRSFDPYNVDEQMAVIRATLAVLNDADRLATLLKLQSRRDVLTPLKAFLRNVESLGSVPSGPGVKEELSVLASQGLDQVREYLQNAANLSEQQKRDVISFVDRLEQTMQRLG